MATERHKDVKLLENFGIREVNRKEMTQCAARILDPISVQCNKTIRTKDGQWRMSNYHVFNKPAQLNTWLIVWHCLEKNKDQNYNEMIRKKMILGLVDAMKSNGIKVNPTPIVQKLQNYSVEEIFKMIRERMPTKPELVVFVISDEDNSYERIKSNAELEYGLVTQCMKFDKLVSQMDFRVPAEKVADDRRLNSYLDNVVKKINAKIGGTNTAIDLKNLDLNGLVTRF